MPTSERLLAQLRTIVGDEHGRAGAADDTVDDLTPAVVAIPGDVAQIQAIVRLARREKLALIPRGGGTKLFLGNPPTQFDLLLSSARLNAIADYDYDNLTVTAGAGATLAQLQPVLAERRQFIATDGPFPRHATLGGVAATNSTGAKRFQYKAPRDLVVGVNCVLGNGDFIKAGGKVVKNVSGFDLNKLLVGSYGTLGLITELTIRVQPLPESESAVVAQFDSLADAGALGRRVLDSFLVPSAVVVFDAATAHELLGLAARAAALVSFEGVEVAVRKQSGQILDWVGGEAIQGDRLQAVWSQVNDYAFAPPRVSELTTTSWKISVPIGATLAMMAAAREVADAGGLKGPLLAHYGTSLVFGTFTAREEQSVAHAIQQLRSRAREHGGYLALLRASRAMKKSVGVWDEVRSDFDLVRRLKQRFDPDCLFSPGRFVGGL